MQQVTPITLQSGNKDNRLAFRKMSFALIVLIAVWIVGQIVAVNLAQIFAPWMLENSFTYFLIAEGPLYFVAFPIYALLMRRVKKCAPISRPLGFGRAIGAFTVCITLMYAGNLIGNLLMNTINAYTGNDAQSAISELLTNSDPLANFIFVAVLAPIFEELIFRKILIDRAVRYGEGVAVLFSGLLFGLFHMNFYQFFYAFFLGLVFAYIYIRTGRVRYPIIFHMIINTLGGIVAPYLLDKMNLDALNSSSDPAEMMQALAGMAGMALYGFFMLAMAFVGIIMILAWRRKVKFYHGEIIIPRGRKFSTVYLNIWMLLIFAVCAYMFASSLLVV